MTVYIVTGKVHPRHPISVLMVFSTEAQALAYVQMYKIIDWLISTRPVQTP